MSEIWCDLSGNMTLCTSSISLHFPAHQIWQIILQSVLITLGWALSTEQCLHALTATEFHGPQRYVWGKSDSVYLKNNLSDMQNWCNSTHTGTRGKINDKLPLSFYFYLPMPEYSESFNNCFELNRSGGSWGYPVLFKGSESLVWKNSHGAFARWITSGAGAGVWGTRRGKMKMGELELPWGLTFPVSCAFSQLAPTLSHVNKSQIPSHSVHQFSFFFSFSTVVY